MSAYLHDGKPVGTFDIYLDEVANLKHLDKELSVFGSHTHHYSFKPVVTEADIERHEVRLGVKLPAVLKEFYLTVGNGGAGPGYGIFNLDSLIPIPDIDDSDEEDDGQWLVELGLPAKLIAIMDLGCGYYFCMEPGDTDSNCNSKMYSYDVTYDDLCTPLDETLIETLLGWIEESRQKIN